MSNLFDKMMGNREPAQEFKLGEHIYYVFAFERMEVGDTAKLLQAKALHAEMGEAVEAEIAKIDERIRGLEGTTGVSALLAKRVAIEHRLLAPMQRVVEVAAGMPDGALKDLSASNTMQLYDTVDAAVFFPERKIDDGAVEGDAEDREPKTAKDIKKDAEDYLRSIADELPLFARHGYKRREAMRLEYWEFWSFVRTVRKEENYHMIRQLNVSALPNLEAPERELAIKDLLEIEEEKKVPDSSWVEAFRSFIAGNKGNV
jgi:hypothetical protein